MAIKVVGVVGCGLMGSGIAQVCAEAGYPVLVREVDEGFLKKGLGNIERFLAKGVEKGKVTPERKAEVLMNQLRQSVCAAGVGFPKFTLLRPMIGYTALRGSSMHDLLQ